ncbi:MAG TPA: hypothetical protein VMB71_14635 [Acetobacteraceae bacterium]|nr:hypothetical protein [Acetobacteraceae bacterium]
MTTMTFTALNTTGLRTVASHNEPAFAAVRAALRVTPARRQVLARAFEVVSGATMAAVPFAAIAWMFVAL